MRKKLFQLVSGLALFMAVGTAAQLAPQDPSASEAVPAGAPQCQGNPSQAVARARAEVAAPDVSGWWGVCTLSCTRCFEHSDCGVDEYCGQYCY